MRFGARFWMELKMILVIPIIYGCLFGGLGWIIWATNTGYTVLGYTFG